MCVCFDDVYLNADWQVSAKCPPKTCYLRIRYPHYYDYDNTVRQYPDISVDKLRSILRVFLESVYFDNEHAFQIKLCFMKAAFHKTCASKVLFLVGKGGSGKGMEAVLAKSSLRSDASATLDCEVFLDRSGLRKSAELSWNKANVRMQEMDEKSRFIADLWKRYVVDEVQHENPGVESREHSHD